MLIVKSDGTKAPFDPEKIRKSLRRTGAEKTLVDHVMRAVTRRVRSGMATSDIFRIVNEELKRESHCYAHRYNLRSALLKLGPAGFRFERYVASILNAYGYETELPEELFGACVKHEVDVVARKNNRAAMIEAKFRNDFGRFVRLKDTLATWSRFNDLRDGAKLGLCPKFDQVWIVTNGKISSRSKRFGKCKGMTMIGWKYPHAGSLAQMVDHTGLYPITIVGDLLPRELDRFAESGLSLCREIATADPEAVAAKTGLSLARTQKIVRVCREVVQPK